MNKKEFIEEMIKEWEGFDYLTLTTNTDEKWVFGVSTIWVGGYEGHWGCDILGNTSYKDRELCIIDVAHYIYDELGENVIEINC